MSADDASESCVRSVGGGSVGIPANVPPAVSRALERWLPGVTPTGLVAGVECGTPIYEAHYATGGTSGIIKITEGGEEVIDEAEIAITELPPSVRARIENAHGAGTIGRAERVRMTFYEIEVATADGPRQYTISPAGEVLAEETE